jgi:citrate lyase subunit beta / citryl-CoA lyase
VNSFISRTYLFVPGNRPERIAKALATGADAVIVDLEDAVPPAEKEAARAAVADRLSAESPVLIRVNGADTPWFADDVRFCRSSGVAGLLLPKAESIDHIQEASAHIGPDKKILPLIETARGFARARDLAALAQVQRLVFGSIDFQADLGIDGEDMELLYFRSELVLVSRLAGIQAPVDGVTVALNDPDRLRLDTLRGKRLGFGAKLCIHPAQVAGVDACFAPTSEDIAWAEKVVQAAAASDGAAVALDGKMVDRPVILKAEQVLREVSIRKERATKLGPSQQGGLRGASS